MPAEGGWHGILDKRKDAAQIGFGNETQNGRET